MTKWQSMGFDSVYQQAVMNLSKEVKVKLCHFPYTDTRYPEYVPVKEDGVWLIHGHQHGKGKIVDAENKMICVSLELWDYRPVESNTIINMINKIGGLNESNKTN
jgi:calcineurin-like phosphoesterase family protein